MIFKIKFELKSQPFLVLALSPVLQCPSCPDMQQSVYVAEKKELTTCKKAVKPFICNSDILECANGVYHVYLGIFVYFLNKDDDN